MADPTFATRVVRIMSMRTRDLDPHNPNAANRDTEGMLAPKPYTPA